jgi:hypothetical protein
MPECSHGVPGSLRPAAARSKLPVQPMRSIQSSQCRSTTSALRDCFSAQKPSVNRISVASSGVRVEVDGETAPAKRRAWSPREAAGAVWACGAVVVTGFSGW